MRFRLPPRAVDAGVVAVAAAELVTVPDGVGPAVAVSYLLAVAALVVRRRWPLPVVLAAVPAAASGYLWLAPMFALGTAAAALPSRAVAYGCATAMFLSAAAPSSHAEARAWSAHDWATVGLGPALFSIGPTVLGRLARTRRELAERLVELNAVREQERAQAAASAIAAERARVAREMHDVVSHQVNLIAMEAGVLALTSRDDEARGAGERIGELSSRTLDELRDMLGVLRAPTDGGGAGGGRSGGGTTAGLAELPALVAASGLPVRTEYVWATSPPLSPETEHAVFRTVQECLTNAAKHAPGSAVDIVISGGAASGTLTVEVTNGPASDGAWVPPTERGRRASAGHGLTGLRERAALLGGTVHTGRTADGGFTVQAELPFLDASAVRRTVSPPPPPGGVPASPATCLNEPDQGEMCPEKGT
ncbi:histidine kinase [Streptomyces venezuelae]|uniref:sensor histidine kinase n=1 Tax=Streptomyces venezuelae TaxID=54571 RepID=UPI00345269FD